MFIELYGIPVAQFNDPIEAVKIDSNRRCINVDDISRIQPSIRNEENRAEVVLRSDGQRYHTVGSYDEILNRLR